jgi:4'-phosphopantetheinyl transferase
MTVCGHIWEPPPRALALSNAEVHVWRVSLGLKDTYIQRLQCILSADELQRAERFYFQRDRWRFTVARGVLRGILSLYLGLEPQQLRFCYNSYGKPALVSTASTVKLHFNVSHSHELALYAVTYDREIGIDVEHIRTNFACQEIAERFFSPQERAALRSLPAPVKYEAFFHCWTRKEAYIKARGEGLSLPLDQFAVSLTPGEPAALLTTHWAPHEAARWALRELMPGPGYAAALAVEGHDWRLACWQWPQENL